MKIIKNILVFLLFTIGLGLLVTEPLNDTNYWILKFSFIKVIGGAFIYWSSVLWIKYNKKK